MSRLPAPVGYWKLNDGSGTTAKDQTGAHNGTASGNVLWNGGAAVFDAGGQGSDIHTSGPVLHTGPGSSFTVSAMAYLVGPLTRYNTIVSQDGSSDSGFYLQYSQQDNRWAFSRVAADVDNPAPSRALSASPPALSTWTRLVGVFDASNDELLLYVNGKLEGTAIDRTPFATSGDLVIGRALYNGAPTDWFSSAIRDVSVYDQALTAAQVCAIP